MTKRLLIAIVTAAGLVVPSAALAFKLQKPEYVQAGTFTFGGNLAFSSLTTEPEEGDGESTSTNFAIQPRIGYFVMPNLELGLGLGYQSESSEVDAGVGDPIESGASGFNIGAGLAYYFNFLERNALYPYVGINVDYASTSPDEGDASASTISILPGVGLALAIGSRTGGFMKLGIDYAYKMNTFDPGEGDEIESTTSGIQVGLGFGLYIH